MGGDSEPQLGEQGIDEIFGWAIRQYRQHLELIYPFLGFGFVSLLLEFRFELLWELFDIDPAVGITADPTPLRDLFSDSVSETVTPILQELFVLLLLGVVLLFVLTFLVFLFVAGIAFLVAADERRGRTRMQSSRAIVVLRRLPSLFVASVLGAVLIAVGTLFFVIPGVYLATRLALGGPAITVDGYGPLAGLKTSWERSEGQLLEIFAVGVCGFAAVSVVGFVPFVGEAIAVLVLLPVVLLALAYLYLETPARDVNTSTTNR